MFRILRKRPLVKDPIAIFSAEWLAKRFNMNVIVLIRHPAAFAGSLKKANWSHPFDHFIKQPLLMEHHLGEYRLEIEEYSKTQKDIIDQACLLWNLIHHMILKFQRKNRDWIFLRHEDISENPLQEFSRIYEALGLKYTSKIQSRIMEYSYADSYQEQKDSLKGCSRSNIWRWKKRLTVEEIQRVKERTSRIASKLYGEESWVI